MTFQKTIDKGTIYYFSKGDSAVAQLFNGLQKEDCSFMIHMALWDSQVYKFDYSQIQGAFGPRVVEMVLADTNDIVFVELSSDELVYIQNRKEGRDYQEAMEMSGCPDGYYGHRPY
ncbi:MAG: hypothetical protein ACRBCT_04345 [Alphaproteobacteria bacterium]